MIIAERTISVEDNSLWNDGFKSAILTLSYSIEQDVIRITVSGLASCGLYRDFSPYSANKLNEVTQFFDDVPETNLTREWFNQKGFKEYKH